MSEDTSKSQEAKDTNVSSDAKDTEQKALMGNPIGQKSRDDIYSRFEKQFEPSSDTSSAKEESNTDSDLKQESDSDTHSEKVEVPTEKQPPKRKRKAPKVDLAETDQKTVPLQALHESRDRFKKLNLEYREYRDSQAKEIKDLKVQLQQLQNKLSTPTKQEDLTGVEDLSNVDHEKEDLKQRLLAMEQLLKQGDQKKAQETALEAQRKQQEKIQQVSEELAEEGYRGFDIALLKTGAKLQELVQSGELSESESTDPEMWKKVYKEHIFDEVKQVFNEQVREEIMESKKKAKKSAQLISSPGKAPEVPEKEEEEPMTYDDFVKQGVKDRMDTYKKRFYNR